MHVNLPRPARLVGALVISAVFLVSVFQNCTSGFKVPNPLVASDNGQTYDGMRFQHIADTGVCADGNIFDSTIQFLDGVAYLTRLNCQNIPTMQQQSVESQITMITSYSLIYSEKFYFAWFAIVRSVSPDSSGNVLVSGTGYQGSFENPAAFIAKYDLAGIAQWVLGNTWFGSSAPVIVDAADGGSYVLTEQTSSTWAVHLDSNGLPLWNMSFSIANDYLQVSNIASLANGNLLGVAYHCNIGVTACPQLLLLTLSSAGQLLNTQVLQAQSNVTFGGLFTSPEGDVYLSATVDNELLFAKLAEDGTILWSNLFPLLESGSPTFGVTGTVMLSTSFMTPVPADPSIQLPSYRWIALSTTDGTIQTTYEWLPDMTFMSQPTLIPSQDGGYIAQFTDNSSSINYVRLDSNFNITWADSYPLFGDVDLQANISIMTSPNGQFLQGLSIVAPYDLPNSTIPVESGVVLSVASLGPNCTGCTSVTSISGFGGTLMSPTVTANPQLQSGPALTASTAVQATAVSPPPFTNIIPFFINQQ